MHRNFLHDQVQKFMQSKICIELLSISVEFDPVISTNFKNSEFLPKKHEFIFFLLPGT